MPKPKKNKRRKIQDVSEFAGLSNLTGFGDAGGASLDDCMAEMIFQGQVEKKPQGGGSASVEDASTGDTGSDRVESRATTQQKSRKARLPSWIEQANKAKTMSKNMMSTEDIENWNRNFKTWAKGGTYTPGLLPNIDQEIARNFKVKELSTLLLKSKAFVGKDLRMPVFERWLLDSKHDEETGGVTGDSVLPLQSSPDSEASQRLLSELTSKQNDIDQKDAEKTIAKLCLATNLGCQELLSQDDRYRKQSPLKKGDRIHMSRKKSSTNDVVTIEYSRKKWKKPFCFRINQKHYQKLKDRFVDIHPDFDFDGDKKVKHNLQMMVERSFHVLILAMLLRYSALSGGDLLDDLRGGGMQGAIHSSVFEVLQKHLCCSKNSNQHWFEGFASPFNATLPRFASAFPDLDWHFGSVGRFLDCTFNREKQYDEEDEEYCEANPPFTPGIMSAMASHMIGALQRADQKNLRLTFIIVVPSAGSKMTKGSRSSKSNSDTAVAKLAAVESFHNMISSQYCSKHILLNAREHGYVEGSQHLRPTQYKQSSYDTSVIILQSPKARATNLGELEKDVRLAFSSRHDTELKERKRKATLGD